MDEKPYKPDDVPEAQRSIFMQLQSEFPQYKILTRWEDFGSNLFAGILNLATGAIFKVPLIASGKGRTIILGRRELELIRNRLAKPDGYL